MKIAALFLLALSGLSCQQSKPPVDAQQLRVEELHRKAQKFEREQKEALERDKKIAEAEDKVRQQYERDSKNARQRHRKEEEKKK